MVNFKNKSYSRDREKIYNPVELYQTLDRLSTTGALRPVQGYILNEWYSNRMEDRDLIVKLHTGEGKTLIGLLMLQSLINQNKGPVIYVCPNIYLKNQVCEEAKKFGIPFCEINNDNQIPNEFTNGEKILITYAHKIFNGKTIFGVKNNCIPVKTILLDDAHACNEVIKGAFTISIKKSENLIVYLKILSLFQEDLKSQGEGSYYDIIHENCDTSMPVPYWAWIEKKSQVLDVLSKDSNNDYIKFVWPLIKDNIESLSCFISNDRIEIRPYNININNFGSFARAERRILMSATTQEDIFFVKGLDISIEAVKNPLTYSLSKWSGEKMVIMPSVISAECDRDYVAAKFCEMVSKGGILGTVAITPGNARTKFYNQNGAATYANNEELLHLIRNLKTGNLKKLLVLKNRYDGIDLPDDSCRVLIIDSLPQSNNYLDSYEERCCPKRDIINKRIAQKIEQGLGRAVRGEKDYCAIIVIGPDIVRFMYSLATRKYFSQQTQKQIEIGFEVSDFAKEDIVQGGEPIKPIIELINQMLSRDQGWKDFYADAMDSIENQQMDKEIYDKYYAESNLEKLFSNGEYKKAAEETQKFIDRFIANDNMEKGWFLEQKARYTFMFSKDEADNIQVQAFKLNKELLKPRKRVEYHKDQSINGNRVSRIKEFISQFKTNDELRLRIEDTLNNLFFGIKPENFESALQKVGEMLGYISRRPDKENGKGPDNLWGDDNNNFIIFECKNNVDENRNEINKREVGQFNNHCGWFKSWYGERATVLRIMIIPTNKLCNDANFTEKVYAMKNDGLMKLRHQVSVFFNEIMRYEFNSISEKQVQQLLDEHKLNISDFIGEYLNEIYK